MTSDMHQHVNRVGASIDAMLNLMDRQIVAADELMIGNVDDLELTEKGGRLHLTGLLLGAAVLAPRLGGAAGDRARRAWWRLADEREDRLVPGWIDIDRVTRLTSDVRVSLEREGSVRPQPGGGRGTRRISDLLGSRVGDQGHVLDVRLAPEGPGPHWVVDGLLVGRGRPGGLLGYDRNDDQGPALIAKIVRRLHRETHLVSWPDVIDLDWEAHTITVRTDWRREKRRSPPG